MLKAGMMAKHSVVVVVPFLSFFSSLVFFFRTGCVDVVLVIYEKISSWNAAQTSPLSLSLPLCVFVCACRLSLSLSLSVASLSVSEFLSRETRRDAGSVGRYDLDQN